MRIEVIGDHESTSAQVRAYAEFRVFTALARHSQSVRSASVVLQRVACERAGDGVVCAVTIALDPSGSVRIRVCGHYPYGAINRAAERVDSLMRRRHAKRVSS
jgi:ribosome-associated translation inhibitor RaiA